jgi:hypothetical protein
MYLAFLAGLRPAFSQYTAVNCLLSNNLYKFCRSFGGDAEDNPRPGAVPGGKRKRKSGFSLPALTFGGKTPTLKKIV